MSTETSTEEYSISSSFDSPVPSDEQVSHILRHANFKVSAEPSSGGTRGSLKHPIPSIDVIYSLIYSDIANSDAEDTESTSQIHIVGEPFAEDGGYHICIVYLHFRNFSCELTCLYHPFTGTFSAFELEDGTMRREAEDEAIAVEDILIVAMQRRKKVDDEYVGEEVKDDNGNPFLFAFMDFGYSGRYPFVGRVYGKMAMPGEDVGAVSLSEDERARLNIQADEIER